MRAFGFVKSRSEKKRLCVNEVKWIFITWQDQLPRNLVILFANELELLWASWLKSAPLPFTNECNFTSFKDLELEKISCKTSGNLPELPLRPTERPLLLEHPYCEKYKKEFLKRFAQLTKIAFWNKELLSLFEVVSEKKKSVTLAQFTNFLKYTQMSTLDLEEIQKIYSFYSLKEMNIVGFLAFMVSPWNNISNERMVQDMTLPLNNYYINSSHNTYLLNNQLFGKSTIKGYVRALRTGCRCVELDCHNGSNAPIIYHKLSLTTCVSFKKVIETIKKYAFAASCSPLILTLEVHCCEKQQKAMALILREVLGDMIYCKSHSNVLPSPRDLFNKIILRSRMKVMGQMVCKELASLVMLKIPTLKSNIFNTNLYPTASHKDPTAFHKDPTASLSFSHKAALNIRETNCETFIQTNKKIITRVYPSNEKIFSSNFNPLPHWDSGVQIVALNQQTHDKYMQIYLALFKLNSGCGYVLKPNRLHNVSFKSDREFIKEMPLESRICFVSIDIYSGHNLSASQKERERKFTLTVECIDIKSCKQLLRFKAIQVDGLSIWNSKCRFQIKDEDFSFIRFKIVENLSGTITKRKKHNTLHVKSICEGYRHLRFYNTKGFLAGSSYLHVKVAIERA